MPTDKEYIELHDEIQRLRDEQQRLRDQQEKLRAEKSDGTGEKKGDQKKEGEQKDGQKDEQGNGKNKNQEEQQKPKLPLKQRARTYVRTHRTGVLLGAVGFLLLLVIIILLWLYLSSYQNTDDAEVDGHLNAISARVNATVTGVYIEDNQSVSAGQVVVDLDPRDFQVSLDQANAALEQAAAQERAQNPNLPIVQTTNATTIDTSHSDVNSARAGVAAAEKEYEAKVANIRQAEAANVKAQTDVKRYTLLVQKEEVSHEQFDGIVATAKTQAAGVDAAAAAAEAARKAVDQSKAQLAQAQSRLEQANQNAPRALAIQKEDLAMKEAAVQAAKAQVNQANLNLSYTKIYAPVSGIVSDKSVEIGQHVQAGEQLFVIAQTSDIWITANFKETQLRKMHPGQAVDIYVDTFGRKYHGYVESMPGATGAVTSLLPPENATGNYVKVVQRLPVRIRLNKGEDPDHLLRPGMSVEPKVWLK